MKKKNVIKLNSYKIILSNKTKKTLIESMFIVNTMTIIILLQREKIIPIKNIKYFKCCCTRIYHIL